VKTELKLSVLIPAHDEEGSIAETVAGIYERLLAEQVPHEILVVNDNSKDQTEAVLKKLVKIYPTLRYVNNSPPNGIGLAIKTGLEQFSGDAVVIVMADGSDSPKDIVKYYRELLKGVDCVFGSRFIKGSKLINYPRHKLFLNRLANWFIEVLFGLRYNDITNAFKAYRRETIEGIKPVLSHHFNITVELPLKAIVRGYNYSVVPISWKNRSHGVSKLKIKEMGSRYLFIILYIWLEKALSKGDYRKKETIIPNYGTSHHEIKKNQ
jgi:dolichol-phosphate mannosyltransferase